MPLVAALHAQRRKDALGSKHENFAAAVTDQPNNKQLIQDLTQAVVAAIGPKGKGKGKGDWKQRPGSGSSTPRSTASSPSDKFEGC